MVPIGPVAKNVCNARNKFRNIFVVSAIKFEKKTNSRILLIPISLFWKLAVNILFRALNSVKD